MRPSKVIHVVGCHAEGGVGDVIVGGAAPPPGGTVWTRAWLSPTLCFTSNARRSCSRSFPNISLSQASLAAIG